MSEIVTGVISGLVASAVFYIFLLLVRPKINVSAKVCKASEDENGTFIKIKVVNGSFWALTNVKYTLDFCQSSGEGVYHIEVIKPHKASLEFISKYSWKDANSEYAIRFSYIIPPHIRISEGWLEFSIQGNHGFSNTSACVKKKYENADIVSGIFETGTSMKILAVPGQCS